MSAILLRSVHAKRALMNPALAKFTVARAMSAVQVKKNTQGWKSWSDIPDSALPPCPDPTNELYNTYRYKRIQKKQIWYQLNEHIPIYFRNGLSDKVIVYGFISGVLTLLASEFYIIFTKI